MSDKVYALTRFDHLSRQKNKPVEGHPVDENMLQSFEMHCIWLKVEADIRAIYHNRAT